MKRIILIFITFFVFCISVLSQKLEEPKFLGGITAGEDPSEFLLHTVMERSERFLEENPEGKLIVRICGSDGFSTSFVKSVFNPLSASNYNIFTKRIIVPYEKIFIAKSSRCLSEKNIVYTQHWFVPDKITIEFDEIFPLTDIAYKIFNIDDYDFERDKYKKTSVEEKEFAKNITGFVAELKNNPKAEGFIVHNSKNKTMKRNIEKVMTFLEKENIDLQRVKTVIKIQLDIDRNEKLVPIKDEKRYFPVLETLTIKK